MPSCDQQKRSGVKLFVIPGGQGNLPFQSPDNPGSAIFKDISLLWHLKLIFRHQQKSSFPNIPRVPDRCEFLMHIIPKQHHLASKPLASRPPIIDFTSLVVPAISIQSSKSDSLSESPAYFMGSKKPVGRRGGGFERPGQIAVLVPIESWMYSDAVLKVEKTPVVYPWGCFWFEFRLFILSISTNVLGSMTGMGYPIILSGSRWNSPAHREGGQFPLIRPYLKGARLVK